MATFFIAEDLSHDKNFPGVALQKLKESLSSTKYWSTASLQLEGAENKVFSLLSSKTDLICILYPGVAYLEKKHSPRTTAKSELDRKQPQLLLDGISVTFSDLLDLVSHQRVSPSYSPVVIFLFAGNITRELTEYISGQLGIDEFGRTCRKIYVIVIPVISQSNESESSIPNTIAGAIETLAEALPGNRMNLAMILDLFPGSRLLFQLNQFDSDDDADSEARHSLNAALSFPIGRGIEDEVNCTLYAPKKVSRGAQFLVQVFLHSEDEQIVLENLAVSADDSSTFRSTSVLQEMIQRKSRIDFNLSIPGLIIDEASLSTNWKGHVTFVQFGVAVPRDISNTDLIGRVIVVANSIPVGELKFKIKIQTSKSEDALLKASPSTKKLRRFRQAFISYASQDRNEVLKRVQMLHLTSIKYFQDLLSLESGQIWEKYVYEYITRCDVFFLFWSSAASRSEWVRKEILYALEVQETRKDALPEIIPVIIEGPPPAKPPEELKFLHFNDRFMYFLLPREGARTQVQD